MKGQIASPFVANNKLKEKKKFLYQRDLTAHSKNLQFSQSHIQNRVITFNS